MVSSRKIIVKVYTENIITEKMLEEIYPYLNTVYGLFIFETGNAQTKRKL